MANSGTIKLYQQYQHQRLLKERGKYYTVKERKRIVEHWRRKYVGQMANHFIQVAPGYLREK